MCVHSHSEKAFLFVSFNILLILKGRDQNLFNPIILVRNKFCGIKDMLKINVK